MGHIEHTELDKLGKVSTQYAKLAHSFTIKTEFIFIMSTVWRCTMLKLLISYNASTSF